MDPEEEWQVGDRLIATTVAAKTQGYDGCVIIEHHSGDGGLGEIWEVKRVDPNQSNDSFDRTTMEEHFKVDIGSRVTDEDVEKARKGLEELLN